MDSSLDIVSPKSHNLYFNFQGDSYCQPITGTVAFQPPQSFDAIVSTQLRVQLIRTITSNPSPLTTPQSQGLLECMRRRFTNTEPAEVNRTCSTIGEITEDILPLPNSQANGSSTESQNIHIPFTISIPVDIPGSVTTNLGEISYDLVAFVIAENNTITSKRQPIHLYRQGISDEPTIEYARSYPNSKVITQISLSQHLHSRAKSDLSFSMNIKLRNPTTRGERVSELKCPAVRGIRCRVEEVTIFLVKSDESNQEVERVSVREICNVRQKSHWEIIENSPGTQQCDAYRSGSVDVLFGFTIPKNANPAQRTDLSCYDFDPGHLDPRTLPPDLLEYYMSTSKEKLVMTVEHRLKLDLLTGEDIFERSTMTLVDRKPIRVALNASFPLFIGGCNDRDIGLAVLERHPPRYEEVPAAPPEYV
ncbi:hypothetical protein N7494_011588 [Penicillium frequentans]|uniref:LDB19 N-terminal domain-containing protein n=1 Tax=Penicillium frequentans TaxID=3151616 RepID=A0AAD6CJY5_9EURO|nr:hypothetical protein N7494_011588 [Penicillium glabrum]